MEIIRTILCTCMRRGDEEVDAEKEWKQHCMRGRKDLQKKVEGGVERSMDRDEFHFPTHDLMFQNKCNNQGVTVSKIQKCSEC